MAINKEKKSTASTEKFINEPYVMTEVKTDTSIKSRRGLSVGLAFTALAIILGLILWYQKDANTIQPITPQRPSAAQNNEPESTTAEAEVESLSALSTSDEIPALEADLESTNLSSLTSDLNQIDAILQTTTP